MADWFRSWHGAPTDPKWLAIARRAGVAPGIVAAVAWALMDRASQSESRGSIEGYDAETLACFFGCEAGQIDAIVAAMQEKGILTGWKFSSWDKRQPKREDGAPERAKQWRELKRTQTNATEHERTLDTDTEENTASAVSARPDLDVLEAKLRGAAGLENDPSPSLLVLGPIQGLIDVGADLERDILPVLRAKAKAGRRGRSWGFYVDAIKDAMTARVGAGAQMPKVVPAQEPDWPLLVSRFQAKGSWPASLGPAPGFSGCRAPPGVLTKHGFGVAAA